MKLKENDLIEQRYKIVKLLNEGGMSYIYLARDLKLNTRLVAIKLLKKQYITNDELLQHEAMTLSKLNHPYIPTIYDFFSLNSDYEGIVMEYIEGITLAQACHQLNRWSKLKILAQLASALSYLHERPTPIIHRDIKPSNIMIDQQLNVKIIDFGISAYSVFYNINEKTNNQTPFGTPSYMAPELLNGGEATIKSDLYSFAVLMLFMWDKDTLFLKDRNRNIEFFVSQQFKDEHALFKQLLLTLLQTMPRNRTMTFKDVEKQLNVLFYEQLYNKDEASTLHKLKASFNIAVLNLNKHAGATSVALSLAQHLSLIKKSIAYMEITDDYANAHLSYLQGIKQRHITDRNITKATEKNITYYYKNNEQTQTLSEQVQDWQTIIFNHNYDVLVLDLSSSEERFALLAQLQPIHLLIVVSSPELYLVPESKMLCMLRELRHFGIPIFHIANKQDCVYRQVLLHHYIDVKQYVHIAYIHGHHIVELLKGNWLHPKSVLSKSIKKRLNKLNFFYKV